MDKFGSLTFDRVTYKLRLWYNPPHGTIYFEADMRKYIGGNLRTNSAVEKAEKSKAD